MAGHQVVAFARQPQFEPQPRLEVVHGDALDAQAVERAVQGVEAVICALGSGSGDHNKVRSQGTATIVRAMQTHGPQRLIALSSFAVGDSRKGPVAAMAWMFLRSALEEHERQEAIIRASNLDWTIIRPTGLTFDAASGKVRVGSVGRGRIARADVAAFMLTCLTDASSKGRSITVST